MKPFSIELEGFRGFRQQAPVPVRKITLLVGDNSAGKTSFLGATKYVVDFLSRGEEPSFNKGPFQLGTFQQIAHVRGGRGGRVKQFSLSIEVEAERQNMGGRSRAKKESACVKYQLIFTAADSQASVSEVRVSQGEVSLSLRLAGESTRIEVTQGGITRSVSGTDKVRIPRLEFGRYTPYIIQDAIFRARREEEGPGSADKEDTLDAASRLAEFALGVFSAMPNHAESTSAIRTKPQRTYTPGIETQDSEGTHVPFELAKLYRGRSKEQWVAIKNSLESFGRASSMFQEIDVKSFGKTSSDPFQLQFVLDGPKMNLVDLGYGTSQVLPIIYDISAVGPGALFFIQQPEVHLHPKAQAALGQYFVDAATRNVSFVLETHSDFIVDRIRHAISEGRLKRHDVSLLFFERARLENVITHIELDELGDPIDAPESYRAFFRGEQFKMLGIE